MTQSKHRHCCYRAFTWRLSRTYRGAIASRIYRRAAVKAVNLVFRYHYHPRSALDARETDGRREHCLEDPDYSISGSLSYIRDNKRQLYGVFSWHIEICRRLPPASCCSSASRKTSDSKPRSYLLCFPCCSTPDVPYLITHMYPFGILCFAGIGQT